MSRQYWKIYYAKDMFAGELFDLAHPEKTHVYVTACPAEDLGELFIQMQGEVWSPDGEARELIKSLGLKHTSMSIRDMVYDPLMDCWWECLPIGWSKIAEKGEYYNG